MKDDDPIAAFAKSGNLPELKSEKGVKPSAPQGGASKANDLSGAQQRIPFKRLVTIALDPVMAVKIRERLVLGALMRNILLCRLLNA